MGGLETTPRGLRRIFTLKPHELQFPLRHPRYVIENTGYKDRYYRANAWGHPWVKVGRSFEELWLNLRCGNFQVIRKAISKRIKNGWETWTTDDYHRIPPSLGQQYCHQSSSIAKQNGQNEK